jgi:acyl-CoA synthetase (AMP-forming)/AMP-acid ligase II
MPARSSNRLTDVVTSPERRAAYEAAGDWDAVTLAARVSAVAAEDPGRLAVVDLGGARSSTYGELEEDSNRLANALIGWGIRPGDVISVQLPNWYETVVIDIGVMKAGAVLNPLLPIYRANELRHVLTVGDVPAFFTPETYRKFDHGALAAQLRDEVETLAHAVTVADPGLGGDEFQRWLAEFDARSPAVPVDAADVSELIFTSGTEAMPKAVMHSEQTAGFSARVAGEALGLGAEDVIWMPSPIGHSTGFNYGVRVALHHGVPLVLQDRWSAEEAISLVESFRCTYCVAATTFLNDIVERARTTEVDLSSLRLFCSGGAPIPADTVRAAEALGLNVLRLYGSTEVLVATWNRPESPAEKRINTDGPPLDHVELKILDEEGNGTIDEPGEILVRGPNTSLGFYDDPDRTAATYDAKGWVHSGDLGVIDAEGFLSVIGRKKEIIIRGGLNIAPSEIEALIRRHPAVVDVAVVGIADERLGEKTCACIVTREGSDLDLDQLVSHLTEAGLATFKLPQRLELFAELPKTPTGKIQKFELVERLEG